MGYMSDFTELFTWTCSRCHDLTEGFVGMAKDLNAIVIAFRGTQERSLQNWIEDLYWKQLDLNYPGMPDAMVCIMDFILLTTPQLYVLVL
ncbi:unnamed protein product [Camellia sinensis]